MSKALLKRIRREANRNGWSLSDVNNLAHLGERTINAWEVYDPSIYSVQRVADVLEVSIDYLLTGQNAPYVAECKAEQMIIQYLQKNEFTTEAALKIISYMSRLKSYEDVAWINPELMAELKQNNITI